jgi:DNA-binding response OmpR family regulator
MDILVIEDDAVIGKALVQGFSEAGHECVWAKDGERGLTLAEEQQVDAIVLDLMLPRRNGLDVLSTFRSKGVQTPVVLLTALGSVEERVKGLNAGADDYVVKPFAFSELLARVSAVCRRTTTRPASVLRLAR